MKGRVRAKSDANRPPVRHSEETKAAIIAHLIAGGTIRATADAVGVPPSTVHRIAQENMGQIGTQKGTRMDDRIFSLIEEIVEGNIAAARLLQDPAYIRQQRPSDLAILAGTQMDKAFRIIIAMERGRQRDAVHYRAGGNQVASLPLPDLQLAGKENITSDDLTGRIFDDLAAGLFQEDGGR